MNKPRIVFSRTLSIIGIVAVAGQAIAAWPTSTYDIYRAGIFDAEHTLGDGRQISTLVGSMTTLGRAIGESSRLTDDPVFFSEISKSAWTWTVSEGTTRLGFIDSEHTSATTNARNSRAIAQGDAGTVAGTSMRYAGDTTNGLSAWAWNSGSGLINIGLTDVAHTGSGNFRRSSPTAVNADGQVIGSSDIFDGAGVSQGTTAWSWTGGGGTVAMGLTDAEHSKSDGLRSSNVNILNNAGRVVGTSSRYNGLAQIGTSTWTWSNSTGVARLGITDADHTDTDGTQSSVATGLNAVGRIHGISTRYLGGLDTTTNSYGQSAWTWTQTEGQTRIGLVNAVHTSSTGHQFSLASAFLAGDKIVGISQQFSSGTGSIGTSSWAWSPTLGTVRIDLADAQHTNPLNGGQDSFVSGNSSSDRAIGKSLRYNASGNIGFSAWTWSESGGTVRIGLTDTIHTSNSGIQQNEAITVAASGRVVGSAKRFNNTANNLGQSIWTWTDTGGPTGTNIRIGLFTGSPYNATNGTQKSEFLAMSALGDIVGSSTRYNGNNERGNSAWFFDHSSGAVSPLVFSIGSQSRAVTTPSILTDTGLVLGSYARYPTASSGAPDATIAFLWSVQDGKIDLGELVDGGLSAAGWNLLSTIISANELGAIAGHGSVNLGVAGSQAVYIVTNVPTPAGAGVLALSGLLAAKRRRSAITG